MRKSIFKLIIRIRRIYLIPEFLRTKGSYGESHNQLIMYSLTRCGICKQKAKVLRKENIAFTEYFIDKNEI
jgi:hypothetical protein